MRQDDILKVLSRNKAVRRARNRASVISVHEFGPGDCTVQIGSRVMAEKLSIADATKMAEEHQARLLEKGIVTSLSFWKKT